MSANPFNPCHDYILVEKMAEGETQSEGGIVLPGFAQNQEQFVFARVIAVGPGRYTVDGVRVPCSCAEGDEVYVAKERALAVTLGGRQLALVPDAAVMLRRKAGE